MHAVDPRSYSGPLSRHSNNSGNAQSPYRQNAYKGVANANQAAVPSVGPQPSSLMRYNMLGHAARTSGNPFGANVHQSQAPKQLRLGLDTMDSHKPPCAGTTSASVRQRDNAHSSSQE